MSEDKIKEELRDELKSLTREIIEKYQPEKVFLFGSLASGKLSPHSDLDLLIIKNTKVKRGVDRIREVWRLLSKGYTADILVYRPAEFKHLLELGDPFLKEIVEKGEVLYG